MRRILTLAFVVLLLGAFACFVWPTPWAYYETPSNVAQHALGWRRHRFSGETEYLSREGWRPAEPPVPPDEHPSANTDRAKDLLRSLTNESPRGTAAPSPDAATLASRAEAAYGPAAQTNKAQDKIATEVALFRARNGKLPASLYDVEKESVRLLETDLLDGWKNVLRYRVLDAGKATFELYSAGKNGVFGDEDDIVKSFSKP